MLRRSLNGCPSFQSSDVVQLILSYIPLKTRKKESISSVIKIHLRRRQKMFNLRWQSRNDSFFKGKSTLNCGFISKLKVQQNKMAHMCEENNSVLIQSLRERMLKEKHPTKEKQLGKSLASNCNFCFQNSYSPPPPPTPKNNG